MEYKFPRSIPALKPWDAVRSRVDMYLGDVESGDASRNMFRSVLDHAVFEHLAGHCTSVRVGFDGRAINVWHDGRDLEFPGSNMTIHESLLIGLSPRHPKINGQLLEGPGDLGIYPVVALSSEFSVESSSGRTFLSEAQVLETKRENFDVVGVRFRYRPDESVLPWRSSFFREMELILLETEIAHEALTLKWSE